MTKIKGKIRDLKELLTLVKLEGKSVDGSISSMIDTCILDCKTGDVNVNVLAKTNIVISFITYKPLDIITEGEIPIGSIEEFMSYLKRFENDDIVSVETTENKIKVVREQPKKTALIPLIARENIDDSLRAESVKGSITQVDGKWKFRDTILEANIKVETRHIREVLADGNVQGLTRIYPISIDDELNCVVGDIKGGMIETTIPIISKGGKAKSSFAEGIDNVFNNLNVKDVDIHLSKDGPMLVLASDEKFDAKFVVAPLTNED